MDSAELGRRLKSARLSKKMTQSDVVGSFITRNMLSQIESGTATPSMKTLEYLSGVLEVPMDELFSEYSCYGSEQKSFAVLQNAKTLLKEQKYAELTALEVQSEQIEDELHALRSIAYLEMARSLAKSSQAENLQAAVIYARKAAKEAGIGLYANETRAAQANQLLTHIAQHLSSYYSQLAAGDATETG